MKILIAEDEPSLRENLQWMLELEGYEVLAACDLTLIASGTATLEAALFKRPMVVVYRLNAFNHWLMKDKAYLPWFSLPNILLRDFAVPELIQDAATPQAIAGQAARWLDDPAAAAAVAERFTQLHLTLRQDTEIGRAHV